MEWATEGIDPDHSLIAFVENELRLGRSRASRKILRDSEFAELNGLRSYFAASDGPSVWRYDDLAASIREYTDDYDTDAHRLILRTLREYEDAKRWASPKGRADIAAEYLEHELRRQYIAGRMWDVEPKKRTAPASKYRRAGHEVSPGQLARLVSMPHGDYRMAVMLMLRLGLRVGEALDVRWGDIYEVDGEYRLTVRRRKGGTYHVLPLVDDGLLMDLRLQRLAHPPDGPDDHVCRCTYDALAKHLARKYDIGCHQLRHTRTQEARRNGADLPQLQAILGHRSSRTTTDVYLSVPLEEVADVLRRG